MNRHFILYIIILGLILSFSYCSKKAKYDGMVRDGLESGERHDTLFLGIYLGMPAEDFYKHCWELNKQGIIRQGEGNTTVLYKLKDELKSEVNVNFYPTFFRDSIYEMPVDYRYEGWAPWNKQYSADTLQMELVQLYNEWYGGGFLEIEHSIRGKAYVKIDGNRRISIYKDVAENGTVWALYTDMSKEKIVKELKKETEAEESAQ